MVSNSRRFTTRIEDEDRKKKAGAYKVLLNIAVGIATHHALEKEGAGETLKKCLQKSYFNTAHSIGLFGFSGDGPAV